MVDTTKAQPTSRSSRDGSEGTSPAFLEVTVKVPIEYSIQYMYDRIDELITNEFPSGTEWSYK